MKPQWTALTNTTLGVLMAGINGINTSIVLIALPAMFRGLGVNPLAPGNTSLLLWILMSYMVVTTTVLVSAGRASDIFGRVRLYTIGFAIFTLASALLTATWRYNVVRDPDRCIPRHSGRRRSIFVRQ
jgi:MFS family permease